MFVVPGRRGKCGIVGNKRISEIPINFIFAVVPDAVISPSCSSDPAPVATARGGESN